MATSVLHPNCREVIPVTLSGTVTSGDVYSGDEFSAGIYLESGVSGDAVSVRKVGVVQLAKHNTANAFTAGDPVYWDTSGETCYNAAATGRVYLGVADKDAGATATTLDVELRPYSDEPGREITLAATGAQTLSAFDFYNGKGLNVYVPNTAALTVTLPAMADVPAGVTLLVQKTSADAEAVTVAADSGDTLVGSTGTIDADNDRALLITAAGGPVVAATVVA